MIEFVLVLPVITLLWGGIYFFGKCYLAKQRIEVAVRYGTWLSRTGVGSEQVSEKIRGMFCRNMPELDESGIVEIDTTTPDVDNYYRATDCRVEIRYRLNSVGVLTTVLPDICISEECRMAGDPWYYGMPGSVSNFRKYYGKQ